VWRTLSTARAREHYMQKAIVRRVEHRVRFDCTVAYELVPLPLWCMLVSMSLAAMTTAVLSCAVGLIEIVVVSHGDMQLSVPVSGICR
jgi:uncharacterized membrane protein